tara:strand:+ start:48 stop:455 length:408 start_codon:yes stop_codon:yes gene_type:complete
VKLNGDEHIETLGVGSNYASSLVVLKRFEEAKAVLRKVMPVARRVLGESHGLTLRMRVIYTDALYRDPATTLADVREAVETLVEMERTARRVLGSAHPMLELIEYNLRKARAALAAREGIESIREGVEAMTPGGA